jgi:hypothetical protein
MTLSIHTCAALCALLMLSTTHLPAEPIEPFGIGGTGEASTGTPDENLWSSTGSAYPGPIQPLTRGLSNIQVGAAWSFLQDELDSCVYANQRFHDGYLTGARRTGEPGQVWVEAVLDFDASPGEFYYGRLNRLQPTCTFRVHSASLFSSPLGASR